MTNLTKILVLNYDDIALILDLESRIKSNALILIALKAQMSSIIKRKFAYILYTHRCATKLLKI